VGRSFDGCGNLRKREKKKKKNVDERIILRWIFMKWDEGMDWIDLAKYRDRWRALVNALMNLWVSYNTGNFVTG
jgi:hypothetical protein